jgi:hypothetical protein
VQLARSKTTYHRVLGRVLAQVHLGANLRVDEAGRAFLWITH